MTTYGGSTFASYDDANVISSLSGGSVSFDADGNMTTVSGAGISSSTLTWDVRNQLTRQQNSSNDLSYGYDASGKRAMRHPTSVSTAKTFYVFSGTSLIGEVASGSPVFSYTWAPVGLISQRNIGSNQSFWYHFGPQKETRHLTDNMGAIADAYRYDGYGKALYTSGTDENPFRYGGGVGYYSEGSTGMTLASYRWYSPDLTRWLSRDPIKYDGGFNLYAYVQGSPILYLDPLGLETSVTIWAPTGWGASSQGHVSVNHNGTTYSFGPNGMLVEPTPRYEDRNSFRPGIEVPLELPEELDDGIPACLMQQASIGYSSWSNNCANPIQNCLKPIVDLGNVRFPGLLGTGLLNSGIGRPVIYHPADPKRQ